MQDLEAPGGGEDLDRLAASLRADSSDMETLLAVLGPKLADALPGRSRVDYQGGGLLRRPRQVSRVQVDLGEDRFELLRQGGGVLALHTKVVGGVSLKHDQLELETWLGQLSQALLRQSSASAAGRLALERLLG